jgi:hypothetical protein
MEALASRSRRFDAIHVVFEQSPLDGQARGGLDGSGELVGPRLRWRMVDAVEQQHHVRLREGRELLGRGRDPFARFFGVGPRRSSRVEVCPAEMAREDRRPVRTLPEVLRIQGIELVSVATPVDEAPDPEAREELGKLGRVPEGVGRVALARDRADRLAHQPAEEQVADVGLAGRQQGVGLDVPGSDRDASLRAAPSELVPAAGPDLEVVLQHDGLAIEQEAVARVLGAQVEDAIDQVDQTRAEVLEGPVPLAVPVGMADENCMHGGSVSQPKGFLPGL